MATLQKDDPLVVRTVEAIQTGDLQALHKLLSENDTLPRARIEGDQGIGESRTLLHIATEYPGHFPNGAAVVAMLITAGADPNASFIIGQDSETPLHWAASSDDVEVLDALIDAGASTESPGAVIGGGTPLDDAVAFGQWRAARRLVERGAKAKLWHAAGLGLLSRVTEYFNDDSISPSPANVTKSFWQSCHGGHPHVAEYLLDRGAELNWIGYNEQTPLDIAHDAEAEHMIKWLRDRGAKSASELKLTT